MVQITLIDSVWTIDRHTSWFSVFLLYLKNYWEFLNSEGISMMQNVKIYKKECQIIKVVENWFFYHFLTFFSTVNKIYENFIIFYGYIWCKTWVSTILVSHDKSVKFKENCEKILFSIFPTKILAYFQTVNQNLEQNWFF